MSTTSDLLNTRRTLTRMQVEQDQLRAELESTGLTSFVARSEWLLEHRTDDEKLADARKWARVEFPRAGEAHGDSPVRPCMRCGIPRVIRPGRGTGLCKDCTYTLSREEIALWGGKRVAA